MKSYTLTESGSEHVIAIITGTDELELTKKVGEAIKDEFCYESVATEMIEKERITTSTYEVHGMTDDGEQEIRLVYLDPSTIAIY